MVGDFDNYWWEDDNVTTLCGGSCQLDAATWIDSITNDCYDQYLTAYGKLVPAYSIADRFIDGLNVACLASESVTPSKSALKPAWELLV
jgi:hypothetical protein